MARTAAHTVLALGYHHAMHSTASQHSPPQATADNAHKPGCNPRNHPHSPADPGMKLATTFYCATVCF